MTSSSRAFEALRGNGQWARWLNTLMGAWLAISAFIWPHAHISKTNTWVIGVLIFISALGARYELRLRSANTLLSLWLAFTSLQFFHETSATLWNNLIVATVVFIASLMPWGQLPAGDQRRMTTA